MKTALQRRTFIFANILESKGQVCVFALNDSDFAKGTTANYSQKAKVIETDYNDS